MAVNLDKLNEIKSESTFWNAQVVAVSKTKPPESILEVYRAGHKIFGENYVQELVDKQALLPNDIQWHFIGHLQSNKVKFLASFISLIHGVDSLSLLKEINKQGYKNNRIIPCLLQIYIAEEESKFGFDPDDAFNLLHSRDLANLKNIQIKGFMGMATNTENNQQIKKEFKKLSEFYLKMKEANPGFSILSMGMTGDYKLALEAGSTMIRIGSAIFGNR